MEEGGVTGIHEVLDWLSSLDAVEKAVLLEGDVREALLSEEGSVGTQSGMPFVNAALADARSRRFNVAVMLGDEGALPIDWGFSSILMKGENGEVCGFEVHSEEERARIDAEGRYVWLSEDFVMDPNLDFGQVHMELPSVPFSVLEQETGARDAVILICSPSTVTTARGLLAPELPEKTSVFVVSFNLLT